MLSVPAAAASCEEDHALKKSFSLLISGFVGIFIALLVGVLLPPVQTRPTLLYGWIILGVSFALLVGVSFLNSKLEDIPGDLFIRNSFILCLVHLLLQTGAVYLFCFLKWTSARVLILHIILLVLTLVVLALLYMSTREIRRQFRETSNGFVSQAKEKLKAVQASPYGTAARDICSQIGYALDGSPQLSGKSSLTIEKNILTVLDNAARASDETQCIDELKQVVPLLSQRSSVL